ncbi:MAG TPA: hypothetical protein VG963_25010 [Polyangiaceae bacterium]|nr:hypothetical protein [Polyangiaceae bacterium]
MCRTKDVVAHMTVSIAAGRPGDELTLSWAPRASRQTTAPRH